jgi:hypothetical protein
MVQQTAVTIIKKVFLSVGCKIRPIEQYFKTRPLQTVVLPSLRPKQDFSYEKTRNKLMKNRLHITTETTGTCPPIFYQIVPG